MTKYIRVKKGDVFEVRLNDHEKGYFQFIMLDITQLNSEVIRVFEKRYSIDEEPMLENVVKDEVQFYAHVVIKWGIKMKLWTKVGSFQLDANLEKPIFRDSKDYGNPNVKVSNDWYVWRVGEDFQHVGCLSKEYVDSDIGVVVNPASVVEKMSTGKYNFFYPDYKKE